MNAGIRPASLSLAEMEAVAALWRGGRRELRTSFSGTSMLPAIAPGQPVTVACGERPRVGDVAVFRYEERIGVHRVVRDNAPAWLLTWGDANALPDGAIAPSQVIGVVAGAPAATPSLARRVLLRAIAPAGIDAARLNRRIAFAHGLRRAWARGPRFFLRKCLHRLLRRLPEPGTPPP